MIIKKLQDLSYILIVVCLSNNALGSVFNFEDINTEAKNIENAIINTKKSHVEPIFKDIFDWDTQEAQRGIIKSFDEDWEAIRSNLKQINSLGDKVQEKQVLFKSLNFNTIPRYVFEQTQEFVPSRYCNIEDATQQNFVKKLINDFWVIMGGYARLSRMQQGKTLNDIRKEEEIRQKEVKQITEAVKKSAKKKDQHSTTPQTQIKRSSIEKTQPQPTSNKRKKLDLAPFKSGKDSAKKTSA